MIIQTGDLASLAGPWDPELFTDTCRRVARRLLRTGGFVFDWYGEVLATARHDLEVTHVGA